MKKRSAAAQRERFDYEFAPDGSILARCRCGEQRIGDEDEVTLWSTVHNCPDERAIGCGAE
jgi:hypothetical protein